MICALFEGWSLSSGRIACAGGTWVGPAYALALGIVLASLALALRSRRAVRARLGALAGFSLATLLLLVAIERPVLTETLGAEASGGRLVVLVDASESFWREPENARLALALAADRVETFVDALPAPDRNLHDAQLIRFGRAAAPIGGTMALANLPGALRSLQIQTPEDRSNLNAGLRQALGMAQASAGQAALILVSDAWSSDRIDDDLLRDYRASGVPVYFVAAGASSPGMGLVAADLGHEHDLGAEAVVRATVLGGGIARLRQAEVEGEQTLPHSDRYRAVRLGTAFTKRGLQGVILTFDTGEGVQERSLFTLVRGPARVLVFGTAPWADALPGDRWRVVRGTPAAPQSPDGFDLVIIDALPPAAFPPEYPQALLAAADGTGLLLVNGGLRGGVDQPQVISEWNDSPLNPILPIDSDPRSFVIQPPPRDVVVLLDVSGSMGAGRRLSNAKSAILAILSQLRPNDSIAILPFNHQPLPPYARTAATASGLDGARRFIAGLGAGGGTIPDETLRQSASFLSNYCAFFFISDADFAPPRTAPQCYTTAISVSDRSFPAGVSSWGEEILIGEHGDAGTIRLRYFEPEERDEYFRPVGFQPVPIDSVPAFSTMPPVSGLAIAYARSDARVLAIHPEPPPDPLIATRRDVQRTGVATGAFLGEMDARWGKEGLPATEAMLNELIGWSDQERYLIRLADRGDGLRLSLTPTGENHSGEPVSASVQWEDDVTTGISLTFEPQSGSWTGALRPPAGFEGQRALLTLQQGRDVQRIPMGLPPRLVAATAQGPSAESTVWGINQSLVSHIVTETGGRSLDRDFIPSYTAPDLKREQPLHALFLVFAALSIAGAVWAREIRDN